MSESDSNDVRPDLRAPLILTAAAVLLGIAPWPTEPIPHLVQKVGLLFAGELTRPIDVFDLFLHGGPALLALAWWGRYLVARFGSGS